MDEPERPATNPSTNTLPQLPRPVFLSFARRDFRIAYHVWQQMLAPDPEQSHADQVLFDFPPLLPIGLKLRGIQLNVSSADHPLSMGQGYADDWKPGKPGWMYAIRKNIEQAQSYVVVLTPHSSRSKGVALEIDEFEAYSDKPAAILSVNRTRIPDKLAKIERAMVHDVTVDVRSMMGSVLHAAFAAQDNEEWWQAGVAFLEAWNLLALFDDPSQELCLDILRGRGRADIQLDLADASASADATELKSHCRDALSEIVPLLETDLRPVISEVIQLAGQAEQRQDWQAMAEYYAAMFSMYRAGGDCASPIASDMLAAKARAERHQQNWDEASKTLKFATFIDQDDAASRAGLTHDLACAHARRAPDDNNETVPWNSLLAHLAAPQRR
jgi:hypothetical protein